MSMAGEPQAKLAGGLRGPLARRYAVLLCSLTLVLLLASGASEMLFSYREAREHIQALQSTQAEASAREISTYLAGIEQGLQSVAKMPWGKAGFGPSQRRDEFYRLMQLVPAIAELQVFDSDGRERLFVSKHASDRVDSFANLEEPPLAQTAADTGVRHGSTFVRDGNLPAMRMAAFDGQGTIVATVDLRLLGDIVSRLRIGDGGLAYIVDARGLLIAHPRQTEVLRQVDLSNATIVLLAQSASRSHHGLAAGVDTLDLRGLPVISSAANVPGTGWTVVMEQSRDEALRPALATLRRTLLLLVLGVGAALVVGLVLAKQMAEPIVALRRATARIAQGELDTALAVNSGDEIEDLAHDFNRMAARLRESYASLEAKVLDRTMQLSRARDVLAVRADEIVALNERLLVQLGELALRKEEAERANSAKTRFLATASHDLRQPMHTIGLLVGLLRERLHEASLAALADKVQSSVLSMEVLFGSLLDISKLDAGMVQPVLELVDLSGLLARLSQTWEPQAVERGLSLRIFVSVDVSASNLSVRGDAVLLERSIGNLIANAIKYTPYGGVLLSCRRRADVCLLQVWDTGPGIEDRYRDEIFEEFFRIDAPGNGHTKGLGLGLAIVRRCAQLLGYRLALRSRMGRGSVFSLTMPCVESPAAVPIGRPSPGVDGSAIEGSFIVVVDDDADSLNALVDTLQTWRCHVLAAASCDEALARSAQHLRAPDLIITDYRLGQGRDGLELIERLRNYHDEAIAALVVTANAEADLSARSANCGISILYKPVGLSRLKEAVIASLAVARSY